MSMHTADLTFNDYIADKSRGLVMFHDHFVGKPGGIAIYYIDNEKELESLQNQDLLKNWEIQIFPLTFTQLPVEFLYQTDFTLGMYGGRRLHELYKEYSISEYSKNVDEIVKRNQLRTVT
jgi:hypothetical protein